MKRLFRLLAVVLCVVGLVAVCLPSTPVMAENTTTTGNVRLMVLNIGKADCMLLFVEGKVYLIDAGYEQTYPALQTALKECGVTHLDGVILTHCHQDHQGGMLLLAESDITVDAWYAAAIYYDVKPEKHPAPKAAALRGQEVIWLQAGDEITVSESSKFTVLGPLTRNTSNENNNSLVMQFTSPHGSILFAADMKSEEEYTLLKANKIGKADILKVPHHGDSATCSLAFLRLVSPKAAVICTATAEEKDTPAPETLSRLSTVGCQTYVTQDAKDALLFTLTNGEVAVNDISWASAPARISGITLQINISQDALTMTNTTKETLNLTGCTLYSSQGNDIFALPDITLEPGASYVIGTRATTTDFDYKIDKKRVWHEEKLDIAILYDVYGRSLACTDNGLKE